MNCSICNSKNPLGAKFCGVCGTALRKYLLTDSEKVGSESAMIGFSDAVKRGFSRYSDFSRRATRAENWWWVLFTTLGGLALWIVDMILGIPVGFLFSLATLIPSLAVGARRLHDINRTGWWLLLILLPILGWIVLIGWAIKQGDRDTNRYGADPRKDI